MDDITALDDVVLVAENDTEITADELITGEEETTEEIAETSANVDPANPTTGVTLATTGIIIAGALVVLCIVFTIISQVQKKKKAEKKSSKKTDEK